MPNPTNRDPVYLALPPTGREHAAAARIELLVALARSPTPSRLKQARWEKMLSRFSPQTQRVIILHGLMGRTQEWTAERLGVTRSWVNQVWAAVKDRVSYLIDLEDV